MNEGESPPRPAARWATATVFGFALTSFFSDVGHEMATAVLPMYLGSLGLGAAALGAVEGIADFVNGLSKLAGGVFGQRARRKKPATALGYLVTAVATSAIGFARTVPSILALRCAAWVGRGYRGPLRDALLADAVPPSAYGRAFGLERAGDMAGAVAGPLLTVALLSAGLAFRNVLLLAVVPGILAVLSVVVFVKERIDPHAPPPPGARAALAALPPRFWALVAAVGLFGIGDFSRSLLILAAARAGGFETGAAIAVAAVAAPVLLYAGHNAVSAAVSLPAGRLADRRGRLPVLALAYGLGLACNLLLAFGSGSLLLVAGAFAISGVYIAVEEAVEKAAVAEALGREVRTLGLGILAAVNAFGDMASSVTVGLLWDRAGAGAAFGTAAAFSLLGTAVLLVVLRRSGPAVRTG